MVVETQNDNEPLQRRVYTMKQLEREIPIGAELLRDANIPVPRRLQFPIPRRIGISDRIAKPSGFRVATTISDVSVSHA